MGFRPFKAKGALVVRISGVPYVLDTRTRQLRAVHDPDDVIDLAETET